MPNELLRRATSRELSELMMLFKLQHEKQQREEREREFERQRRAKLGR